MPAKDKDYSKKYYQKNKEKLLKKAKILYENKKKTLTPEQKAQHTAHQKIYYQKNKEAILKRNRIAQKEWYKNNKDVIIQRSKDYRLKNLGSLKYRFRRAIQTAKQRGIDFSLTFDQFSEAVSNSCYYCNFQFCSQVKEGSGLDRIDSSKGYEIGNVISCGHRCNMIKNNDLSMEETKAAVRAILQVRANIHCTCGGGNDGNGCRIHN